MLRAVPVLGGSAKTSEITAQVVDDTGISEKLLAVTYEGRPQSR